MTLKQLLCQSALMLFIAASCYAATPESIPTPQPTTIESPQTAKARLWNLQDADILSIINEVSLETGKNFVVDPRVSGKISLISSKPIKPDEVYQVFLSIIELLGYSAIQNGSVVKIVPNMESGELATRIATQRAPGKGEEVVVRVIPLENLSANQLIPVIRPLMPQWSNISAYVPGNVLILLGRAANLQRIANIIHNIDTNSSNQIDVVALHQANASQVATVLNNLQSASRATGETSQVSIAADERSNSILLSGNKAARLRMRLLISQLDTPSGTQGNTEVVYLKYLQAKQLAPLLGKIAQNILGKGNMQDINEPNTPSTAPTSNNTTTASKASPIPENRTNIQAEPNTNALVITAPPSLMRALNNVIAKLDVRPAQVLVEGIIVEIDETNLKNLGIQWGSVNNIPTNTTSLLNGTNTTTPSAAPNGFPALGTNVFGIIPGTDIKAVLSLLENRTGVDILSTPSIVVLDNQKATLEIGKQVPVQNGAYATTGQTGTVTPFNTITNQNVTLKLDVTPQINLSTSVRLKIKLKNDSLQNPDNPTLNPIINTSTIDNSVIINSQDVLVLGGLISNSINENTDKIPFLGDLPIVGKTLFTHQTRTIEKKNLVVFLKPVILQNAEISSNITNMKYNEVRQEQITYPHNLTYGGIKESAILPPFKNPVQLPKPFESQS